MINLKLAGAAAFLVIAPMVMSSFAVAQQAAGTISRGGGGGMVSRGFGGGGGLGIRSGGGFGDPGVTIGRSAFGGGGGGFVTSRPGFVGRRAIDPGFGRTPGRIVSRSGVIGEPAGISGGRRWHGRHWRHGWGGGLGYWSYDDGYYDDTYVYDVEPEVEVVADGDSVADCMRRFRSYDPASGTYLGYDGLRHACP